MTCKDCLHYDVCNDFIPSDLDRDVFDYCREGRTDEIPDIEERCNGFKDKSRYIELPFKVGDTVYVPWRWGGQRSVAIVNVEEIKFYDSQMHYMFLIDMESDDECFNQSFGGWKIDRSIGKTVFLTREEAEKILAERE